MSRRAVRGSCLLLVFASLGGVSIGRQLNENDAVGDLLNHPAFAGFGRLLLPWDGRSYDTGLRLRELGSLLPVLVWSAVGAHGTRADD